MGRRQNRGSARPDQATANRAFQKKAKQDYRAKLGSREKRNFRKEQKLAQRKLSNLAGAGEVRRGLYLIQCGIFVLFILAIVFLWRLNVSFQSQRMITWPDGCSAE